MIHSGHSRKPRQGGPARVLVVVLVMLSARAARGEQPAPATRATFAVHLVADGVADWQAGAIARTLAGDLTSARLVPGRAPAGDACTLTDRACALAAYGAAGIDVAIRGRLAAGRLTYEMLLTWPGASPPVWTGAIDLTGRDRSGLADAMRTALHPLLRPDGPLERRDRSARPAPPSVLPGSAGAALVALPAVLVLLVPLVAGALLLGPRELGRLRRARSLGRAALALVGLAALALGVGAAGGAGVPGWAAFLCGGMAWGGFAAVTLPVLCPPLVGLGRVEAAVLWRVARAWSALVLRRAAALAAFYAPVALALWWAPSALGVPALVALGVVAPLWFLLARLCLRALVEVVALRLDRELIEGDAGVAQVWDDAVRRYFLGCVRRAGGGDGERLLGGVRFAPGRGAEVALYGGGLTHPRLVLGRELLEAALAPCGRPHDYALPRVPKLHWTEWNAGLVVPTRRDLPMATREERQPIHTVIEGESEHQPLGEPRTLAGIVEPSALDQRVSHRPWEDPAWLAWDPSDEPDGTDPGDQDRLFGLLVHELGRARRHEDRAATFALAWQRWLGGRPRRLSAWLARPPALADAHAILNFTRHHWIQFLAHRLWRRDDLLTARALAPELERCTREIAAALEAAGRPEPGAAPLRRRLAWILALAQERRASPRIRRVRRAALVGAALAVAAGLAASAARAVDYHSIYLERTRERPRDDGKGQ